MAADEEGVTRGFSADDEEEEVDAEEKEDEEGAAKRRESVEHHLDLRVRRLENRKKRQSLGQGSNEARRA